MSSPIIRVEWTKTEFLSRVDWLFLHKIAARTLFIVLVVDWYLEVSSSEPPERRFAMISLLLTGPIMAIFHLGLWLSTIKLGSKYRMLSMLLLLPSLLSSIMLISAYGSIYSVIATAITLWSYWIVFKRD